MPHDHPTIAFVVLRTRLTRSRQLAVIENIAKTLRQQLGTGHFTDETDAVFPSTFRGNGFDVAVGDVNGDGKPDLFLANRFGEDRLLLAK